jgi:hypothetical protein
MERPDLSSARAQEFMRVLQAHATPEAVAWLAASLPRVGAKPVPGAFFASYAVVGRRVGSGKLELSTVQREGLARAGVTRPDLWSIAELARAVLLLCAIEVLPEAEHVSLVTEIFRKGDSAEQAAAMRALALLPHPQRFVELAADACRSNVLDVFASVACDNPFPAAYFPQLNFNQMVMKALFVELSLERILGWRARLDAELSRMACDYEAERRAAGRLIPADLTLLIHTRPAS